MLRKLINKLATMTVGSAQSAANQQCDQETNIAMPPERAPCWAIAKNTPKFADIKKTPSTMTSTDHLNSRKTGQAKTRGKFLDSSFS